LLTRDQHLIFNYNEYLPHVGYQLLFNYSVYKCIAELWLQVGLLEMLYFGEVYASLLVRKLYMHCAKHTWSRFCESLKLYDLTNFSYMTRNFTDQQ
jgi:hypothetical protein